MNKDFGPFHPRTDSVQYGTREDVIKMSRNLEIEVESLRVVLCQCTAGLQIAVANLNAGVSAETVGRLNEMRLDAETVASKIPATYEYK